MFNTNSIPLSHNNKYEQLSIKSLVFNYNYFFKKYNRNINMKKLNYIIIINKKFL